MVDKTLEMASQAAEKAASGVINQMEPAASDAAGGNQTESERQLEQEVKKVGRIAKEALMAAEKVISAWPAGTSDSIKEHIIGEE